MPQIVILPHPVLCPEGSVIDAPAGKTLCDALLDSDIDIEHACEKSCACTTCHVVIREGTSDTWSIRSIYVQLLNMIRKKITHK